ncbi:Type I Iterative PKS [Diaporthe australafricana]|uniref:Type I Iterative PKS n=1 Tax=Diaporthe australafricana TaxID=127596 RepID=A0ABR3WTG9_9PEZI
MKSSGLLHQVVWAPARLVQQPLHFRNVIFLVSDEEHNENLSAYRKQLADEGYVTSVTTELEPLLEPNTVVVHIPQVPKAKEDIFEAATKSCTSLITAAQLLYSKQQARTDENKTACKLFSLITNTADIGDLANAPLFGLARVMKMEAPETFGGLVEEDQGRFPLSAIKHAQGFDVVKVHDGVSRTATLLTVQDEDDSTERPQTQFELRPDATYLITGGTRGIGLETATWMGQHGARNILLVSSRGLPAKNADAKDEDEHRDKLIARISELEALGATVRVLAVDLSKPGADTTLGQAIADLHMPPVKGVVHAAGVAGYHTLERCAPGDVASQLAPKVLGALALDALFPPGTLDLFVLTSSVGQLVGFPGQLLYGPANAFLDGLAAHRRRRGDSGCTAVQWTSWRGVGLMAQSRSATRMIAGGMRARGFADISKEEALEAYGRIVRLGADQVAVVRALEVEADEPPRHPMLRDITPRRATPPGLDQYPDHAVAVVGMACRTAAGETPEDLWQLLKAGGSMERRIDPERFPEATRMKNKLWGNFLPDVASFDHQFFKKSRREAAALDPHQRLLLETAYHALEDAGWLGPDGDQQEPETHEKKPGTGDDSRTTGCFIGMNAPDYPLNLACHAPSPYTGMGMLRSFASGRLSHHFGWTGPSHTIDTACSSAMVAVHQACRALQAGECTRAVAGGANLITNTALFEAMRVGSFLNDASSGDAACRTFDAGAGGYCRGEAVGVVVLRPLRDALRDGDDVLGVLLATGNNQNLNVTSITNPVLESQAALYRTVLARAGISADDVSYVEAHGTGTRAGDPVEVEGIRQVLGGRRERRRSGLLHVGAVKPNVGHSEGASGIVSLVKVLLMLRHGEIPPQAHFDTLNPNIAPLEPDHMAIATSLKPWKDDLRLALVNSYGASGNNAAAAVAPPPQPSRTSSSEMESPLPTQAVSAWPIFISASSTSSLSAYCRKLREMLDKSASALSELLPNLAYALAKKQNRQLRHVFSTRASSLDDLKSQLSAPEKHTTTTPEPSPVVLLFSGQNGDTVPPARALYDASVLFRRHLRRSDKALTSLGLPTMFPAVLDGVQGDAGLVLRHAAMFSIQYSCGMSWIDSGVRPGALCGHSFGEWAALTVSGALTLEAGRASIIQKHWGKDTGCMIAIEADLVETNMTPNEHLAPFREENPGAKVDIACYNGPDSYVVAGGTPDIELLESYLGQKKSTGAKLRFKVLRGMYAYHSVLADPIVDESAKLSASIPFKDPIYPFESCHEEPWTGPGTNVIGRNTRHPVYFKQAISRITNRLGAACTFLEAGIGGPITTMARNALPAEGQAPQHKFVAIGSGDPLRSLADATATLWRSGQPGVQFWPFHRSQRASYGRVLPALPQYQFDKSRHWLEYTGFSGGADGDKREVSGKDEQANPAAQSSGLCPHCHKDIRDFSYIVRDEESPDGGAGKAVFKVDVRSKRYQDLVSGHVVVGSPICPAAMYLELVSHAVVLLCGAARVTDAASADITVEGLQIRAPLGMDAQRSVRLALTRKTDSSWGFDLTSTRQNDKPTSHATGTVSLRNNSAVQDGRVEKGQWARMSSLLEADADTDALRGAMVYKMFGSMARYSPAYCGLRHLVGKGGEGAGDISMPADGAQVIARTPNDGIIDPVVVDTFLQVPGAFVHSLRGAGEEEEGGQGQNGNDTAYICTGMGSAGPLNRLLGGKTYRSYAKVVREGSKDVTLDVFAFDKETRKTVWSAKGLTFSKVPRASLAKVLAGANPALENSKQARQQSAAPSSKPAVRPSSPTALPKSPDPPVSLNIPREPYEGTKKSDKVLDEVQDILCKSLDIPVEDATPQALLEDLGADSLVSSEILASISERMKVDISLDEFGTVTDVASLCSLITSKASIQGYGDAVGTGDETEHDSADQFEAQGTGLDLDTADGATSEWQKTVIETLSVSLDVPVSDIEMDSKLEDLGADSLVGGEIISTLNDALGLDITSTDFSSVDDVISLCNLVAGALGHDSPQDTVSSTDTPRTRSSSGAGTPVTEYAGPSASTKTEFKTGYMHQAFQQVRLGFDAHAEQTTFAGYWERVDPQQLRAVTAFIVEAFEKLGCPISRFSEGEELPALQVTLPKYQREVSRLWGILEDAGLVRRSRDKFLRGQATLKSITSKKSAEQLSAELISDFPEYASPHGLFKLLGPALAESLTGKADPVSLLFGSDKGRKLAEDFYANGPDLRAATQVLCDFVSQAIRSRPHPADGGSAEPFRILEIGAGTGGTTKHLLPLLQATGLPFKYTFTELSPSLLARARRAPAFRGCPEMDFLRLDVEADRLPDHLLGRHHLVVSSNCVHATRDLRRSLANIRSLLLAPGAGEGEGEGGGGCVALVELTQPLAWYDLVWGLLDGWWLFDDGRSYALQSPWAWERAMRDAGFAHADWSDGATREARSVRVICGSVAAEACPARATSVLLHRGETSTSWGQQHRRNLFLAPDGFGSGAVFGGLQPLLGGVRDVAVYALNSPFIKCKPGPDQPVPTIEELAASYVAEIKRRQPEGPYLLGGYSVGGVAAFEAARQLLENGDEVEKLLLIDSACPTVVGSFPDVLVDFLDSMDHVGVVDEARIREKNGGRLIKGDHFALSRQQLLKYTSSGLPGKGVGQAVLFSAKEGVDKQDKVSRPRVLPEEQGTVDWFLNDRSEGGSFGWDQLLENVSVVCADGNHFSMMKTPMISQWGTELAQMLSTVPKICETRV